MARDPLEFRSRESRWADQCQRLEDLWPGSAIADPSDLAMLPVLRKDAVCREQSANPPFGTFRSSNVEMIFQSPGPIYEPGSTQRDWWRFGRFLAAIGLGPGDVVQNTFSYHFTPAGAMFGSAASAVGATIVPTGPGHTAQQAEVAAHVGTTAYAGTPDYLAAILAKARELGLDLSAIKTAAVSAGPLFPQVRDTYLQDGILCRQCYGTADAGLIAYESADETDGMIVDEDVILEIVTPGTGTPVEPGEIGEVLVTVLNPDYPLLRFSTGDLSATLPGTAACGRTNTRIVGWRGRADQAAKVKGMFIRPEQVARLVERHDEIERARVEVSRNGQGDLITVHLETSAKDAAPFEASISELLKLRATVALVEKGALPRDGTVIADLRPIGD